MCDYVPQCVRGRYTFWKHGEPLIHQIWEWASAPPLPHLLLLFSSFPEQLALQTAAGVRWVVEWAFLTNHQCLIYLTRNCNKTVIKHYTVLVLNTAMQKQNKELTKAGLGLFSFFILCSFSFFLKWPVLSLNVWYIFCALLWMKYLQIVKFIFGSIFTQLWTFLGTGVANCPKINEYELI